MDTREKSIIKSQIEQYLDEHYEEEPMIRYSLCVEPFQTNAEPAVRAVWSYLQEQTEKDTFSEHLLRIIRDRDLKESDVYNRVFMDRTLFSKIRSDSKYKPSKRTAILLALALCLSFSETQELLGKAGYKLTHSDKGDLIVEFFISRGNYNVIEINEMLAEFHEPLLLRS